jgi:spore maturation protein CgeB
MRILIVGSDEMYAIENFYKKYFLLEGAETTIFTAQNYFYEYYQHSLLNKLIYKSGFSRIISQINDRFIETTESFRPDVVWIFKGMEIIPASLQWVKQQKILLVNYNPDNPFIFTGPGSGNKNITDSISLYDLHFTYNLEVKNRLESGYGAKTFFLPFGFDADNELYESCTRQTELLKTCFLGNPDKERSGYLKALLDKGVSIDVYGNHWHKFLHHKNLQIFEPVGGNEFWKVLSRYRVQLNLMRIHNEHSHNMRSFEIPGIGAIQLAPDTPEHRMFFTVGEEIFLFSNIEECCQKIDFLLKLSEADANQIRKNARKKSVESDYY